MLLICFTMTWSWSWVRPDFQDILYQGAWDHSMVVTEGSIGVPLNQMDPDSNPASAAF